MIILRLVSWVLLSILTIHLVRQFKHSFGSIVYWGLAVKPLGVLSLAWTYLYYYGQGDTLTLLSQIKEFNIEYGTHFTSYLAALFGPIDPFSGNPRTVFFVRLMSPFGILFGHQYLYVSIPLAVFSYWTTWSFLSRTVPHFPQLKNLLIACFGFLPTYVFWSSGLLKDTLVNGCLMFLSGLLVEYYHSRKLKGFDILLAILLFYLLFMTRHYLAGLWCIVAVLVVVDLWVSRYGLKMRFIIFTALALAGAYSIRFFFIRLRPERFPITFHELHEQIIAKSSSGSITSFDLQPTWTSFLMNLPKSLWAGLFRPGLWEVKSVLQFLESLQTTLLFIGFLFSAFLLRKIRKIPVLVLAMITFVVVLATFLPLATPNFGSLSRYRVAYAPFLAILVIYLPYRQFVRKDL